MGNPYNYGVELPKRCLALIDALWDNVLAVDQHKHSYGGPLTTTFLLALGTPVIVLPVERLLTWRDKDRNADDRLLDGYVAERVRAVFDGAPPLSTMPFFDPSDGWRYVYTEQRFNIAEGLREDVAVGLNDPGSEKAAANVEAMEAVRTLRNALAHGVVGFVGADGFSTYGEISTMIAFVGESRVKGKYVGSHVLRISESGFRSFLRRWVDWLNDTGLSQELAA